MGYYEMAEIHAVDNDSLYKVLESKALKAFEDKKYVEAAEIYADTELAFEKVCLQFIDLEDKRPIITIQKLIAQHADPHNLAQFAIANEDYQEVIEQHISAEKYLDVSIYCRSKKTLNCIISIVRFLLNNFPKRLSRLMAQGRKPDISKLIPTLITIESPAHIIEIIKYLEYAIYNLGETNQAIHNFLLRLYCEHQPEKIMKYLENEGTDSTLVHYDIYYALSVCLDYQAKTASVFLYCLLELWPTAVDLALEFDVKFAKEIASKPKDEELKSNLWLKVACHEIKDKTDVKKALELLEECDLLKIEDLLPFFSDFERIDDFKEPICKSLKEYNQKIQELQHDMEECSKQADRVRNDLQNIRTRCIRIDANDATRDPAAPPIAKPAGPNKRPPTKQHTPQKVALFADCFKVTRIFST
ncbi:Vacuolar protein sorting-associated protein 18 homolog [Eumeta japonica]|uniref:Vacuolar protein sorting-associated protein 18 homolog n=1 Tax=Eumeta variegata TaxID=151549 RepID=A0A4C2AEI7_EUMVA|nr:Vacuolar protein sorting-associated protein 18 homolog [Eumeta japonica]